MRQNDRNKQLWFLGYLGLVFALHMNAILKTEDPIADTQTDPILYEKKMEEEKGGVKAPASPRVIYYGGQGFLAKKSLSKYEKEATGSAPTKKKEKFNWSDWWEDKPAQSNGNETQDLKDEEGLQENQNELESLPEAVEPLPQDPKKDEGILMDSVEMAKPSPQEKVLQDAEFSESVPSEESGQGVVAADDWW